MIHYRRALLASVALALAPFAADAQERPPEFSIDIRGWVGGAFAVEETGQFTHCGIFRDFDNGISMVLATNPDFQTNLGLRNPDWSLEPGEDVVVQITIDNDFQQQFAARYTGDVEMVVPTGRNEELIDRIRRGNVMTAITPIGEFQFPLTGTFDAVGALFGCVETANALLERAPTVEQGMTPEVLASILEASGLEDFQIAPPDSVEPNAMRLSLLWTTGDIGGGLHQTRRGDEVEMEAFADAYVDIFREACLGDFSADEGETDVLADRYALKTVLLTCTTEESNSQAGLFFALDDFYYSVFIHEGNVDNTDQIVAATDGIAEHIRSVAVQAVADGAAGTEAAEDETPGDETPADETPSDEPSEAEPPPPTDEGEGEGEGDTEPDVTTPEDEPGPDDAAEPQDDTPTDDGTSPVE